MAFEYIPGDDFFHRRDPRTKIFMAISIVIMSVWFNDPVWLISLFIFELLILKLARIPLSKIAGFIRGIFPVAVMYFIFNLILPPVRVADPLVVFYLVFWTFPPLFPITVESVVWGIGALFRFLIILVMIRTVLMLTPIRDLILALTKLRVPPEFALAVSIGLGYLPVLIDENRRIKEAQQARGWEYEFRNPAKRFSALLTKMLIPSIANSMRRTRDIATAIESRGFGYNLRARTYLHEIKMKTGDYLVIFIFLGLLLAAAFVRGLAIGGQFVFGLGLADFQVTARFVRSWVTTPAYSLFVSWMNLIPWSIIPFVNLLPLSYMHVQFGQYFFLLLMGLIVGLIAGIISRGKSRKVAFGINLAITIPLFFGLFYLIWPMLPTTFAVFFSLGWFDAILAQNLNLLIAYLLLIFITVLWPYTGSVMGTIIGRFRGGKKTVFIPPPITDDD
ncbi:MAG: energy-coupling factor transporter transmembrane component T [Candidatus Hermodarchaeota archaeon]|nr:energy-coupling factor transporter transmembrane component T [Candidatus Hermodarchaeota archaeon]